MIDSKDNDKFKMSVLFLLLYKILYPEDGSEQCHYENLKYHENFTLPSII